MRNRQFEHLGEESSQDQEEDHWALILLVEDAVPIACIHESSNEVVPFDKVVGGRNKKRKIPESYKKHQAYGIRFSPCY